MASSPHVQQIALVWKRLTRELQNVALWTYVTARAEIDACEVQQPCEVLEFRGVTRMTEFLSLAPGIHGMQWTSEEQGALSLTGPPAVDYLVSSVECALHRAIAK